MQAAWRALGSLAYGSGRRAALTILIFHRVRSAPDPLRPDEPAVGEFTWQMDLLASHFNVLPLTEAVTRLAKGTLPARAACITFDDGYADNAELALPILQARGLRATFFVASGYLDGGIMWNDLIIEAVRAQRDPVLDLSSLGLGEHRCGSVEERLVLMQVLLSQSKYHDAAGRHERAQQIAALCGLGTPPRLMMNAGQVRKLAEAGMEIGAHTATHPILTQISLEAAREEIERNRSDLRSISGQAVRAFAYPNGKPGRDFAAEHVRLVRELGFDAAVTTSPGVAHQASDCHQLPRFTPWDKSPTRYLLRLLVNRVAYRPQLV